MTPPPPEVEVKREFEAPRAGARFVYVANSGRDTVAVIDSSSLKTVGVGDTPTYLPCRGGTSRSSSMWARRTSASCAPTPRAPRA
jgi:YVTN family beta-propeller protein